MFNWLLKKRIYLDYASLTPIDKRVLKEMKSYSGMDYANSSAFYKEGVRAKKILGEYRAKIANNIHAQPEEIYFTSGGTESNNLAILGVIESLHEKGLDYEKMHVLVSIIEHSSIRECVNYLQGKGVEIELIPVNKEGLVEVEEIRKRIKDNTVIVSIMMVNNEIGSIQPIREISKEIRHYKNHRGDNSVLSFQDYSYPVFHTDASQAFISEEVYVEKLGVDLLTLDSSKVYGPRGVGLLFIKKSTPILPIIFGGGQENNIRSGTENFPGIIGFAKALDIVCECRELEVKRLLELRRYFIESLKILNKNIIFNGPQLDNHDLSVDNDGNPIREKRNFVPQIINISIPKIDNEFFVLQLDAKGIACSTKSSCLGDEEESYVLNAIGANSKESIRFSLGRWTNKFDIDKSLLIIKNILNK